MIADFRYALRGLRRHRALTFAAVLTLGLGIGAATAVFSVIDVVYFRPLPLAHENRLVRLRDVLRGADGRIEDSNTRAVTFEAIAAQNRVFEALAAFNYGSASIAGDEAPERLSVVGTTAPIGGVLGVRPVAGRDFASDELAAGSGSRVALISHALWIRRFAEGPIAGVVLPLNGVPHAVIGVLPPGFRFPYEADVWVPTRLEPGDEPAVFARLQPGIGIDRANADLAAVAGRLIAERPDLGRGFGIVATPARQSLVGNEHRVTVGLLVLVVGLLLLTAADVASLLLARALSRRPELALRAALGASRARLVGPAAAEAALIAAIAAGVGLAAAVAVQAPLATLVPGNFRHELGLSRPTLDFRTLAFCLVASAIAAILCAAAAASKSASDSGAIVGAGRAVALGRKESRGLAVLVAGEIALAMALLCGAGAFAAHLRKEERRDLGLRVRDVVAMQIALPPRYASAADRRAVVDAILREARTVPGVAAAGVSTVNPLAGGTWVTPIVPEGVAAPDSSLRFLANYRLVTPGLLPALGLTRLSGRDFDETDREDAAPVALVSRSLAERFWPGQSAVGERLRLTAGDSMRTVVGVVGDVADAGDVRDTWYVPFAQRAGLGGADELHLMIRAAPGASLGDLSARVRRAIARADGTLAAYSVATMDAVRREVLARERFASLLIAVLAGIGTLVALLGTYGVAAYRMQRRRADVSVRIALGAGPYRTLADGLGEGFAPVVAGLAAGALLTLLEGAALPRLVPGVLGVPAWAAAALAVALAGAALSGLLLPALRFARLDPAELWRDSQ